MVLKASVRSLIFDLIVPRSRSTLTVTVVLLSAPTRFKVVPAMTSVIVLEALLMVTLSTTIWASTPWATCMDRPSVSMEIVPKSSVPPF